MMDSDAVLAAARTPLQRETHEPWWRGASLERPGKSAPVEQIPTMSGMCL
jgi:hypothetical protein